MLNDFLWYIRFGATCIVSLVIGLVVTEWVDFHDILGFVVPVVVAISIWIALMCDFLFYKEVRAKKGNKKLGSGRVSKT